MIGSATKPLNTGLTLLPLEIEQEGGIALRPINLISLTLGTALDLKCSLGTANERALIYEMLRKRLGIRHGGVQRIFRGGVIAENWPGWTDWMRMEKTSEEIFQAAPPAGARQAAKDRRDRRTKNRPVGEQHGVAQRAFILDAAGLLRRCRGGRKRQPLPPGAGPSLLPADRRIARADDSACGERDLLKIFSRKALRIRGGPAQPGRHRCQRHGRRGTGKRGGGAERVSGAESSLSSMSARRLWQSICVESAAPVVTQR